MASRSRRPAPQRVAHLFDDEKRRRGEFAFTPVVRLDYLAGAPSAAPPPAAPLATAAAATAITAAPAAAAADGGTVDEASRFDVALTLVIPHCFSPADGAESVVLLGAPHGARRWQALGVGLQPRTGG